MTAHRDAFEAALDASAPFWPECMQCQKPLVFGWRISNQQSVMRCESCPAPAAPPAHPLDGEIEDLRRLRNEPNEGQDDYERAFNDEQWRKEACRVIDRICAAGGAECPNCGLPWNGSKESAR